jgi:hypothetical protein
MVDVKSKRCAFNGCTLIPSFNHENEKKGLFCSSHKTERMVNVKSKRCAFDGCSSQPSFNHENEKKGLFCSSHKTDEMVDVKSKRCAFDGCTSLNPGFNHKNEKKGLFCSSHKTDGMVDVKHSKCNSEWCFTRVTEKYDGYCLHCFMHLFPNKPVSRNYKTKEFAVVNFVKITFPDFQWIADKRVADGCSRKRPDLLLDLGDQIVIVEIDENQHIDYDCSCENKRIMELSQDVGHRPIVFVRFNPDDYETETNKVSSCWSINGKGICSIKKSKWSEWQKRLSALENQIRYWCENKTNKTIEIIQLFYDKFM